MMEKATGLCRLIWAIFYKMPLFFAYETMTFFGFLKENRSFFFKNR